MHNDEAFAKVLASLLHKIGCTLLLATSVSEI